MEPASIVGPSLVGALASNAAIEGLLRWPDVEAAAFHGLAWDVYSLLEAGRIDARPPARRRLTALREQTLERSMGNAATASTIADALKASGVQALIYKGSPLAFQTTGDWRGRDSQDVDVLVAPSQVAAAHRVLADLAYVRRDGHTRPPGRAMLYYECERAYDGVRAPVDLHWRVDSTPGFLGLSFAELWQRREWVSHEGLQVWTPGLVDALLITAVHGTRERWSRLRWALDATRQFATLRATEWSTLRERAGRGAAPSVHLALAVAQECGAGSLAWQASNSARLRARSFLAHAVDVGYGRARFAPVTAGRAWQRRRWRAQVAPNTLVKLDDFSRATIRQLFGSAEQSLVRFGVRHH